MATEQAVLNVVGKALWDKKTTVASDLAARQLAVALGYPTNWRVVREVQGEGEENSVLVDRIYAGQPGSGCDMWFNHAGAMEAAATWEETAQTGFDYKGGHMLPRQALFDTGQKVQVLYEDSWWDAKILRRKEYPSGFKYQVYYTTDSSKQSGVEEELIRHRPTEVDPAVTALNIGFGEGWKAFLVGHNKYKIISPDGTTYKTKKAALEAFYAASQVDEGDPPWRTTGNEYLGRKIWWTTQHKASARRTVALEQVGTITGWISETDVDSNGEPGFVDKDGIPARLYHATFPEDPHHAYANHLLAEQDLEEYELLDCLLPVEEEKEPPKKKARTR